MSVKKHIVDMASRLAKAAPHMSNHKADDVEALLVDASNLLEGPRTYNAAHLYADVNEDAAWEREHAKRKQTRNGRTRRRTSRRRTSRRSR
jgi:hypothetical protein